MSAILARRTHRRAFRREVLLSCQVVRERDFRLLATLALDLSTDGMLVATEARVLTGEEVIVSFRGPRSDQWFDASATVARVVHGRRPSDAGRCLGLAFDRPDERWKRALFRSLRGLPPPEPGRSTWIGNVRAA